MTYIKICYFIVLSLVMTKGLYFLLTIFQQEHYHIPPYTKSFLTFYFKKAYNYLFYFLIIISLLNNVYLYLLGFFVAILSLLIPNKLIIKLKLTRRIVRLLLTYLIFIIFLLIISNNLTLVSILYIFNPFIVILINLINAPFEKIIKYQYINKAKKKLKQTPSLLKIAITGSYGKTSTKNIISAILENKFLTVKTPHSYNTIMGLTKVINKSINQTTEIFVCEMGTSKKGEIAQMESLIKPQIGIITDVGYQHISTLKTIENVLMAKFELLNTISNDNYYILNGDNELIKKEASKYQNIIYYGFNKNNTFNAQNITISKDQTSFDIYHYDKFIRRIDVKLLGRHNIKNILCAYALIVLLKDKGYVITDSEFYKYVNQLEATPHRLSYELVNNIHIYDDAYNSNLVGFTNSVEVLSKTPLKKVIITPGIVDEGKMTKELNEKVALKIKDVFDEIYIIDNYSGRYVYNKLSYLNNIHLMSSFKEAYLDVLSKYQNEEIALLIENDLPDNYLVRRKKHEK